MEEASTGVKLFCSYAHEDEKWLRKLEIHLSLLKQQGLISLWHDRLIVPGTNWAKVIDTHLETASVILLLVSADFFASDYCVGIEMKRALERQEAGEALVVPILVRQTDWTCAPFAHLHALPTDAKPLSTWPDEDTALTNVAAGIRRTLEEVLKLSVSAPRAPLPAIWNIPYPRNPFFMGREDLLSHLHAQLQRSQPMALSQHPQAINGLGGIGKTQIAIEYAYRFHQEYQVVLWAHAESREAFLSSYVTFAMLLNLPEQHTQEHAITVQAIKRWLQTHSKWLLILDNADELTLVPEFLPSTLGGHLLLTTRAQAMGRLASRIEVETFSAEQGALFLLQRAALIAPNATLSQVSIEDRELATQVTQELGGLPLALDQAGAYLEETGYGLKEYQQIYQRHHMTLLKERRSLIDDHPTPVATTWSLSFQYIEQKNPVAAELLRLCAYLAPDAIPEEIIIQGASHLGSLLKITAMDPFLLGQAIEALRAFSLVSRDPVTRTLSIHRLIQVVLRDGQSIETGKQWMQRTVLAVNETWSLSVRSPDQRVMRERCLSHALLCVTWIKQTQMTSPEAADLLSQVGNYLRVRARHTEAEPLLLHALAMNEKIFGSEHLETASCLYLLANLYNHLGKHAQAESLFQRALVIYEQHLDFEPLNAAESLNNFTSMAWIYYVLGKHAQAESLFQRALVIYEQHLDINLSKIADCATGLAHAYHNQGKNVQAELLFQRALAIQEQISDAEIYPKDIYLQNLARLYSEQGKNAQAEPLFQRALAIREQHYGAEHPYTARILGYLALLYQNQGKYEQAGPLFQRALHIQEQIFGPEHPDVASLLYELARLFSKQRRDAEAEPLYLRALHIWEQRLISDPHDVTIHLSRGYAYLYLKKREDAYADFVRCASLQPRNVNAAWMVVYTALSKQYPGSEIAERLEMIAALDPQCYEAHICRGVALGLCSKLQEGLKALEQALHIHAHSEDAWFWKGMMCAYLDQSTVAVESIEQALQADLPPILLTPLFWLEQEKPHFYQEYAEPLLKRYGLV